jgi:hypothetical protein
MATKRVEYIGKGRPGVVLQDANGRPVRANYGEPIEIDAGVAKGLLSQSDNWREPKPGPKPKPAGEGDES